MKQHNNIREFTRQFYRKNAGHIILALLSTIMMVGGNLLISYLMQVIVDACAGLDVGMNLLQMSTVALICVGTIALAFLLMMLSKPRFVSRAIEQYKNHVFEKITKKGVAAFSVENTSSYISLLSNDCASIEKGYLENIFNIVDSIAMLAGALALMIYYSPLLTLISILLSLIPLIVAILTGNTVAKAEKITSDKKEYYMSTLKDSLVGFSAIKSFKAEKQLLKLFKEKSGDVSRATEKRNKLSIVVNMISSCAGVIVQLGVFIFGTFLALNGKGVSPGMVIIFVQLLNFVINPLGVIPQAIAEIKASCALISKTADLLSKNVRDEGETIGHGLSGNVCVRDLSFSFDGKGRALDLVSFDFEAGKSYAIVGSSGSGKSTLLNLLMGSNDNYSGSIAYGGHEVRGISSDSLYDAVSLIQQNVFIFNRSLKDNITMFQSVERDELDRAIRLSGLSEMVALRGEDFVCGENGCRLSGGEKQRVAIARSLLKRSDVLLVDEATAALDPQTSFNVSSSILDLDGITRIVVTHDLDRALLQKYDCILTLRQGRIEESGDFESLMANRGYFYSLFTVSQ